MSSFSEPKVEKLMTADGGGGMLQLSRGHMVRTYPAGTRVDSSNYFATNALCSGAQLVALNFQTRDLPLETYLGFFADNGDCGYILKPYFLRGVGAGLLCLRLTSHLYHTVSGLESFHSTKLVSTIIHLFRKFALYCWHSLISRVEYL